MVAAVNQDFTFYSGDASTPIFTVTNGKGGPAIDISSAAQITFQMYRAYSDAAPILVKTKTGGAITFVTNGIDGKFQVQLLSADTATLSGFYVYACRVVDNSGNQTTVTIGSIQVGVAVAWTYDSTSLAGTDAYAMRNQVRTLIADTNPNDKQLWDAQIDFAVSQEGSIYSAAAACCLQLAAKYSRDVDITEGSLHRSYSARQRAYSDRAKELKMIGSIRGGGGPYGGGISVSDKQLQNQNTDRVQPAFLRGLTDNWLPVAPVDNEIGMISGTPGW